MELNYFQLAIVWLLIGVFGKIYDDAIDMYFIQHGTLFLELVKLILTGLGVILLFGAPDIYTSLIVFSQFCVGPIVDYEAFLNDNYWYAICIVMPIYAAFYIYKNFKQYRIIDILILFAFFNLSGLPMIQSCVTLNGPVIDYIDTHFCSISWIVDFFDQTEINGNKLAFRVLNVILDVALITFLQKYLFRIFNIRNDELFNICLSCNYFALGYSFVSALSLAYNIFIDNVYERRKKAENDKIIIKRENERKRERTRERRRAKKAKAREAKEQHQPAHQPANGGLKGG